MTTNEVIGVLQTCVVPHCKTCLSNREYGGNNCKGTEYALDALKIATAAVKAQQEAEKKPLTNADHIRAMDDEELVCFWSSVEHCGAKNPKTCQKEEWDGDLSPCDQCFLAWLKQPYKEW